VDNDRLFEATPRTLRAYRHLCRFLWGRRAWSEVLIALDRLDELLGQVRPDVFVGQAADPGPARKPEDETSEEPEAIPPQFAWASEDAPTVKLQLDIAEKRATALGLLGKWPDRLETLERHAALLDLNVRATLDKADRMLATGRHEAAMRGYYRVLQKTPHNIDALIGMARVTSVPYWGALAPYSYDPLSCLFRLVVNNHSLTADQCGKVTVMLRDLRPNSERDKAVVEFAECVAILLESGPEPPSQSHAAAIHRLHKLASSVGEAVTTWRQRHLVWYYLGMGYEQKGDIGKARRMYGNVLGLVPTHRHALAKLVGLAKQMSDTTAARAYQDRLDALKPRHQCATTFGGRIRLLGYSVSRPGDAGVKGDFVRYYWEFLEPVPVSYSARTYFLDHRWHRSKTDLRRIAPPGGIYPTDLARCGEVIVESRPLTAVPPGVKYIGIDVCSSKSPKGWRSRLARNGGDGVPQFPFVR